MPTPDPKDYPGVELPLNLGLNDGTYAAQGCVEVLKRYDQRTSFRWYSSPENDPLRDTISELDGVRRDQIFLHNGTGPILKLAVRHILKGRILASKRRVVKHLVSKDGFPIITPRFTYSKVPKKAAEGKLHVEFLPLGPENDFALDVAGLRARLEKGPGLVYLVNPNNPTGRLLIQRDELIPLLKDFPEARFWIDEAYVQYVDPAEHTYVSDLVAEYSNLFVSRSFSFAHGLAAVRIGYLLADEVLVSELLAQLTDYRLGGLQQDIAVAALRDKEHLPHLRAETEKGRNYLRERVAAWDGVESFSSQANFILCRFTDGRTGEDLAVKMKEHQIRIKHFEPANGERYDPYFRLTVGLPEENRFVMDVMEEVLRR